jgi:hypothetical protein
LVGIELAQGRRRRATPRDRVQPCVGGVNTRRI